MFNKLVGVLVALHTLHPIPGTRINNKIGDSLMVYRCGVFL